MLRLARAGFAALAAFLGVGFAWWGVTVQSRAFHSDAHSHPSMYLVLGAMLIAIGVPLLAGAWVLATGGMRRPWLWVLGVFGLCLALAFLLGGGR